MLYAQFFQNSANSDEIVEACGSDGNIILDGRHSSSTNGEIAAHWCAKRGYLAWQIFKGETFTRSRPVSQIWYITPSQPVSNPAWLSAHGM